MKYQLKRRRNERGRQIRRMFGDSGGHCKFKYKEWYISPDPVMVAVTTIVFKDIMIIEI